MITIIHILQLYINLFLKKTHRMLSVVSEKSLKKQKG